jgi:tetratricopeptide (TPR) repeat protein
MLESYLKPVLSKHRGVALGLWGEAGIGKSYYTSQLLKNLPCATLSIHSKVNLAALAGQLPKPSKLPLWASKILEKVQQGESVESSNLISALGASLTGLAPFVLHLEDIHEADAERLAFFTSLAQTIKKLKGVCLLISSRQLPSEPFRAVKLESLTKEASDKLLEQELSSTLPKEGLEFIYSKAAGNPLFTLEYLRFLTRQGNLWNDGRVWHWRKPEQDRMPVVVEALLEQMIEGAKQVPMQAYVLEAKALLPFGASTELWEKVARVSSDELTATLQELSKQGIFKKDDFAHPLFKEVTLKTLSTERKQNLSRRAINVLKDHPLQAIEFLDSANVEKDIALGLLGQTAAQLVSLDKPKEASRCLEKAFTYAAGEEKGQLALGAAQLASSIGDASALVLAQQALPYLNDTTEAHKIIALAHARRGEQNKMKLALSQLGPYLDDDFHIECLAKAGAHEAIINLSTSLVPETLKVSSIHALAFALMEKGELTTALTIAEKQLKRKGLEDTAKAELLGVCASVLQYQGKYQEAEVIYSNILDLLRKEEIANDSVATTLRSRALNRSQLGYFREALPDLHAALDLHAERGSSMQYAQTLVLLSNIYFELGEYEKTETLLLESLTIFERVEPHPFYVYALTNLTYFYSIREFNVVLAIRYAQKGLGIAQQLGSSVYESMMLSAAAFADTVAGYLPRALAQAEQALSLAKNVGFKEIDLKAQSIKALVLVALGKKPEALSIFQTVMQEAQKADLHFAVQRIGIEFDCLNNDVESARTRMQWFEERGLMNGVNIAKRHFPELATAGTSPVVLTSEELPRLDVLGVMQLRQNNQPKSIKGSKRQEFLALLLEAKLSGRAEVARLEFLDVLYPQQDELKASTNVRDLVSNLRELMGANAILTTASGYALGNLESDAELFLKTGDTSLWRGVYLQGLSIEGQETVSESLYLTLFEKAKGLLEADPEEVARVGKVLLEYDPYNRDYLTLCLQAFRESNNHKSLTRLYTEAKERFVEVGETLPVSWQTFLS